MGMPRSRAKTIPLRVRDLGRWRLLEEFQDRLGPVCERMGVAATFADTKRHLELGQYLGLFLFGLLNPAVRTMRALCAATHLERLQREICGRPVSLGSFSETQPVKNAEAKPIRDSRGKQSLQDKCVPNQEIGNEG